MASSPTFTVSTSGGLTKSNRVVRDTILTLESKIGDLEKTYSVNLRVEQGSTQNIDPSTIGITTVRVVALQPSVEGNFGSRDSSGVIIRLNGSTDGVILKERSFYLISGCEISSLSIENQSGSVISPELFLAGE